MSTVPRYAEEATWIWPTPANDLPVTWPVRDFAYVADDYSEFNPSTTVWGHSLSHQHPSKPEAWKLLWRVLEQQGFLWNTVRRERES